MAYENVFYCGEKNQTTDYAIEVPLDPESVAGDRETSHAEDETTNSDSNPVPIGPRTLRITIGGSEVMNSEEEKENGDDDSDPQPFNQVQTRLSQSSRTMCPRQLHQNECQSSCVNQNYYDDLKDE